ncbi:SusC/RagA family TonB-linked outer membrane protein [Pedobacter sp. AW31-3R]|uniref:SusC/RagA family TonB-linked outer membrane protein n=1 Tax=Pedobacter sp. AW31-3R TaxID=3445781 RepID=UPI003FA0A980
MYKTFTNSNIGNWKSFAFKVLLIMRLTVIFLLATLLQVSASSFGQKITLKENAITLKHVFSAIKKQTGYTVIYFRDKIDDQKTININFDRTPLEEVLNNVLAGQAVTYTIQDKAIVLKEEKKSFMDKFLDVFAQIDVRGRVLDPEGNPLVGATITIKGSSRRPVLSGNDGSFLISNVDENSFLVVSYVGYELKEVKAAKEIGDVNLVVTTGKLEEVGIVSTGYQNISKERLTGSVTVIDNALLNRAVSPDFLSRLNSVTNGLLMNANSGNNLGISIRGKSTLFSSTRPLVVVDNFPFEGDVNTINPNDIENISVLKDAAAASIWGVKAGNGVIVITTKKGRFNQKPTISFNSNLTIGAKPDLNYTPQLTSAEYIEVEKFLYEQGKFDGALRNDYEVISPVVALLAQRNSSNSTSIDAQIEAFKQLDSRKQIKEYFYRNSINQQYYLNVNGGGSANTYNLSAGYDRIQPFQVASATNRFTFRANNTFNILKDKLQLSTDLTFNSNKTLNENARFYDKALYPYETLADQNGNALPVLLSGGLRASYTDTVGGGRLLNWKYKPLEELRNKANVVENELVDVRLNTSLVYKIIRSLSLSLNYQYYKSAGNSEGINNLDSYQTRHAINRVTRIDGYNGVINYPFPLGSTYNGSNNISTFNYGRTQVDYQYTFFRKHHITALAGYEIRSENAFLRNVNLVGYDPETAKSVRPNNVTLFPFNFGQPGSIIFNSNPINQSGTTNHYISSYSNLSYAYDLRYVLYGSYRKDESNLFGVKSNQKGVPLWSTGVAWNIDQEVFFKNGFLEQLQLKASFGYNGNVNQNLSAYTTASSFGDLNNWGALFLMITNPPNPSLKWEKVKNINIGIDFSSKNRVLSGSIELYGKKGLDLIGQSPLAQQTGIITFTGNVAHTMTRGLDIQLSTQNVNRLFKWTTTAYLNIVKDKVTKYMTNTGTNSNTVSTNSVNPLVGYPINSIFSYKTNQLDSLGNPQGFFNGSISQNYTSIAGSTILNDLRFHGSAIPTVYGAFRNSFSYQSFDLSINISYKLGYYIRTPALRSSDVYSGIYQIPNYDQRWQKRGDEFYTDVPSLLYPANTSRDSFYQYSESRVERGDHIRLNDILLTYTFLEKSLKRIGLKYLNIYLYASNLGIVWRSNKQGIDPDVAVFPSQKNLSIGLKATL